MSNEIHAKQKKNIYLTVGSIVFIMVVFFGLFLNKMLSPRVLGFEELRHNNIIIFEQPREIKSFSLLDQHGQPATKDILKNKISFVFFGFTHCPDVCPATLAELSRAYNELSEEHQQDVQIVLVSLDPARDTPEKLKTYVEYFHEDTLGLTGEFPSIMSLAKNVNIAFQKVVLEDDYTIDHSSQVVILNRHGDYAGFIKAPIPVAALPRIIESTLTTILD